MILTWYEKRRKQATDTLFGDIIVVIELSPFIRRDKHMKDETNVWDHDRVLFSVSRRLYPREESQTPRANIVAFKSWYDFYWKNNNSLLDINSKEKIHSNPADRVQKYLSPYPPPLSITPPLSLLYQIIVRGRNCFSVRYYSPMSGGQETVLAWRCLALRATNFTARFTTAIASESQTGKSSDFLQPTPSRQTGPLILTPTPFLAICSSLDARSL